MTDEPSAERTVIVHQAGSWTEAVVIRGLLESAGIASPASTTTDPFPMRKPPQAIHGVEIVVLESQAEEARRILQEYLDSSADIVPEESPQEQPDEE